jgi:hypothetical protein
MKKYLLKCFDGARFYDSNLQFRTAAGEIEINLECENIRIRVTDTYPFLALTKIRLELAKHHLVLICNGAKLNVYPSGAALQSIKAYELEMGKPVTKENLVVIFESTDDVDKIVSVDQQKEFYRKWLESVGVF